MEFPSAKPARNKDEPLLIGRHNSSLFFKVNQLFIKKTKIGLTPAALPPILNLKTGPRLYYSRLTVANFYISPHVEDRLTATAKPPEKRVKAKINDPGFR